MPVRVVFCGTADIALPALEALIHDPRFEVLAVVTQPDKPSGRHLQLRPPAVKTLALQHNLPVLQPNRARDESFLAELQRLAPDLLVVIAYGQILPQSLLDIPRSGCLNIHTSILPRHRGAAPIQWAIWSGDSETGVTIMKMDAGLDTGPVLSVEKTPISPDDTAQSLHDRLAHLGADLLLRTIPDYISGRLLPVPQPEGATYARKITKEDGKIDWTKSARDICLQLRALTPWPGAFTTLEQDGKRKLVRITAAVRDASTGEPGAIRTPSRDTLLVGTGEGSLRVLSLQAEGRKMMSTADFLMGNPLSSTARFI